MSVINGLCVCAIDFVKGRRKKINTSLLPLCPDLLLIANSDFDLSWWNQNVFPLCCHLTPFMIHPLLQYCVSVGGISRVLLSAHGPFRNKRA